MSILKLMHQPTRVHISKLAKANCRKLYGDDFAALMFESVKSIEEKSTKQPPKSLLQKIINKFRPEKQMTIQITSNQRNNFFVNSHLKIGDVQLTSEKIGINMAETLNTLKHFKKAVEKTKDDILRQLTYFNEAKRFLDKKVFKY